ncbi:MAG: polysaccharide deacetylase family protein [bacterium]|nr:polysaccharide deacetylase family protein [bacterium]
MKNSSQIERPTRLGAWLVAAALLACAQASAEPRTSERLKRLHEDISGTVVVRDLSTGETHVSDAERAERRSPPYSTFKIWNTLFALDAGVVSGPQSAVAWDREKYPVEAMRSADLARDQTLESAFRGSVLWYYREVAQRIGASRMRDYLARVDYGDRDMSSGIDGFWIRGSLKISPYEQVDRISSLLTDGYGFSTSALDVLERIAFRETIGGCRIYGKTGAGRPRPEDHLPRWKGWFVGWARCDERLVTFATFLETASYDELKTRRYELSLQALGALGLIDDRVVAVTLDDLPFAGGSAGIDDVAAATARMLDALDEHDAIASAFVTGSNVLIEGQIDARVGLLRDWHEAGHELENHSFSHPSFNRTESDDYLSDVMLGQLFPDWVQSDSGRQVRFFRAPFNHTGPTPEKRKRLEAFLTSRDLRLAPFTVEHSDYIFNALYARARKSGDREAMLEIGEAYLAQLDVAFSFAEELSRETFGREIPQVLLIHANAINGDYLGAMLSRLAERGYRFETLDRVVRDPAYDTLDAYPGKYGISWLHRWRVGLELEDRRRDEPDPPAWVLERYREAQQ